MDVIIRPRGGGKTTEIVKKTIENDGVLLVHSRAEKDRLILKHPEIRGRIETYDTYTFESRGSSIRKIYIDELDAFLRMIFSNAVIGGVSINGIDRKDWDA